MAHGRPWYKRNGSDLIMATLGFPSAEHKWAYSAIIDMLNDRDRALPDEPGFICGFTGLSKRKWTDVRGFLIDGGYLVARNGELTNPRFERERQEREAEAAKAKENGRKGGAKSAELRAAAQGELPIISEKTGGFSGDKPEKNASYSADNSEIIEPEMAENRQSDATPPQASCGRERASEARGENREEDSTTNDDSTKPATDTPIDRAGLLTLAQVCARAGGVTLKPERPQVFARELDIVRAWIADGVNIERTAVPTIATAVARLKDDETVGSLRYFDSRVRKAHARTLGDDEPRKPAPPPVAPLRIADQDDDRVRQVRKALNGNPAHAADAMALAVEDDGGDCSIIVTARSLFALSRVDRDQLRELARNAGCANVEFRTQ